MKNAFYKVAMMIGLSALGTSGLMAQQIKETGTIPFDFQVSGQKVKAGTYTVTRETNGAGVTMSFRDVLTHKGVYVPMATNQAGAPGQSKLVFRKYGDRYFLAEIWFPEESHGHVYQVSAAEKEMLAKINHPTPELTFIAMR